MNGVKIRALWDAAPAGQGVISGITHKIKGVSPCIRAKGKLGVSVHTLAKQKNRPSASLGRSNIPSVRDGLITGSAGDDIAWQRGKAKVPVVNGVKIRRKAKGSVISYCILQLKS